MKINHASYADMLTQALQALVDAGRACVECPSEEHNLFQGVPHVVLVQVSAPAIIEGRCGFAPGRAKTLFTVLGEIGFRSSWRDGLAFSHVVRTDIRAISVDMVKARLEGKAASSVAPNPESKALPSLDEAIGQVVDALQELRVTAHELLTVKNKTIAGLTEENASLRRELEELRAAQVRPETRLRAYDILKNPFHLPS